MVAHSWYRRWNGTVTDPKWRTIARLSGQELCRVLSVWDFLLEDANANETERGRTKSNAEDIASAFDLEIGDVEAIISHMQGRVLDGDLIINWSKRQPAREDDSASRAKKWREEQKLKSDQSNSANPPNETERKRTQPNAEERSEKSREEKKEETPPLPPSGGQGEGLGSPEEEFKRFWEVYPRKTGPDAVRKIYFRRRKRGDMPPIDDLLKSLAAHRARSPDWRREDGKAIPNPAKWLSEGQWANQFPDAEPCGQGQGQETRVFTAPPELSPEEEAARKEALEKAADELREKLGWKKREPDP